MTLHSSFHATTDAVVTPATTDSKCAVASCGRWLRTLASSVLALGGALASTLAFAVTPTATVGITPGATPLVGDAYCFSATMTNAGDTGYGPYMRLVLPAGVTFTSATYLASLAATATNAGTIPTTDSIISQPVATPVTVPPSTLWLIRPPIGSMVTTVGPNGFQIPIRICTQIAPTAVPNAALGISVQGAYQFGDTPTGANGPIVGTVVPAPVTPGLVVLTKSNDAPETERPPGPAWPINYRIAANIADTKTLTAVVIQDVMPADMVFQGPVTITGGTGCVATTPVVGTAGGTITVNCTSALGTAGTGEVVVTYLAYIKVDALSKVAVQTKPELNTATLNAQFAGAPIAQATATSTVTAAQAVVQKSAAPTSVRPGDVVTYTLAVQTTQFDTLSALSLRDVLPDGINFGSTLSATINGTPITVTPTITPGVGGITTVVWNVTAAPGVVLPIPVASTVVLRYTGTVRQTYLTTSKDVLAGDVLPNSATLTATMTGGASGVTNISSAPVTVIPVTIQKTLLNPQPFYQPGDLVTFRLQMSIDAGRTSNLVFKDFFPLPVFDSTTISTVYGGTGVKRAVGGAGADTLNLTPTSITANAGENSLTINWPDVSVPAGSGTNVLAVDITVKVTNKPFADGLSLTNLMEASNSATGGAPLRANEGVLFKVNAPVLKVKKGVLSATGAGVIAPAASILPVDGNVTGTDAGDVVTFRITVENTGGSGAYQIKVTDTAVANLSSCTLVAVKDGLGGNLAHNGTLGATFPVAGLALTNPLLKNDANPVGGGAPYSTDTALIDVSCPVGAAAGFNASLLNTASVTWTAAIDSVLSYPAVTDTATVGTSIPLPYKEIRSTSEAHTTGSNVVVGEIIRYRLSVAIPEGGPFSYSVQDSLPAGLQFLNDGSAKFALVSQTGSGLTSSAAACANSTALYVLNQKIGSTTGVVPACSISANHAGAYANGEASTFNFGNITNTNSDIYDEYLILDINALVVNSGNTAGSTLNNSFVVTANSGTYSYGPVTATLQAPNIGMTKTVSPATADAGDTVTYTVTYTNSAAANTSTAYDVVLTDVVPATLNTVTVTTMTPAGGASAPVNNSVGNALSVSVASIPAGGAVTVKYTGVLAMAVTAGQTIANTANLAYTSLPGSTGSGAGVTGSATPGASGAGNGERIYAASASASLAVAKVTLAKTVLSTSMATTGTNKLGNGLNDLAIGEQVTFRITATLPEGTISQVKITDSLPASAAGVLKYLSSSFVIGSNLNPAVVSPAPVVSNLNLGDGIMDTVSYDFGQVINPANGSPLANRQIYIDVVAVVVNVVSNSDSKVLTNNSNVQFGPGLSATASVQMDIVEPSLQVVKDTTATIVQAGQVIPFTVTVSHAAASHADAFDVSWTDTMPAGLTYVPSSLVVVSGPVPTLSAVGNALSATWATFPQASVTKLSFNATVDGTVVPGQTVTNKADLAWTSTPGANPDERTATASGSKSVVVSDPGLSKVVLSTSEASTGTAIGGAAPDLTIGEHVFYRVTSTFIEGTTPNAKLVDQLPKTTAAFKVVSSKVISVGNRLSGPGLPAMNAPGVVSASVVGGINDVVTWNVGSVFNNPDGIADANDQIVFEIEAVVLDNALNKGVSPNQTNIASFTYDTAGGAQATKLATAAVDVVEPVVKITKALTLPASGLADAGDQLTFRITLAHQPTSSADAFNVVVTDVLPLVNTWVSAISTCGGLVTDTSAAPTIKFTLASFALATGSCTVDYKVNVNAAGGANPPLIGQTYINNANLQYDSTPVYVAGETRRDNTGNAQAQFTVPTPTLLKGAVSTNVVQTGSSYHNGANFDMAIGELVDFDITVIVPEGNVPNSVITDQLPMSVANGFLEAVGASVVSIGANISTTKPGTPVLSDTGPADGLNDKVVFDFGTITNAADGVSNAADTIVVRVTARVVDKPANANAKLLTNNASFTYTGGAVGGLTATAAVDVVEPILAVTKGMTLAPGGFVDIVMTLNNSGNGPAYNASVEDVLSNVNWDLSNIASVSVPAGFVYSNTAGAGINTVKFASDSAAVAPSGVVMPGGSVTFVFRAKLINTATPVTPVNNVATLTTANSIPEVGAPVKGRPVTPKTGPAVLDLPSLVAKKSVVLKTDADGSGGASPGDTLTYTITLKNQGTAALTGVSLADTPDVNTLLQVGSVTTTAGSIILGNTAGNTKVQVNLPTISAGTTATVTFDVNVADILPVGVTQVSNQGNVTSNELPLVVTDDPVPPGGTDPTVTPVTSKADLRVVKTPPAVLPLPGQNVNYSIVVTNLGPNTAAAVQLADVLPPYLSFVSANAPCVGGFPCALGNMANGAQSTINLVTKLDAAYTGLTVANTATVSSVTPDPVPVVNNTSTASQGTAANILVTKVLTSEDGAIANVVESNETLVYTITMTNTGGTGSATYSLTDLLTPAGAIATVTASDGGIYTAATDTILWNALNVPPAAAPGTPGVKTVTVSVKAKPTPFLAGLSAVQNQAFTTGTPIPVCPGVACVITPLLVPNVNTTPAVTKTVISTSLASTGTNKLGNGLNDLVVGEQITFRITATLPEGTIGQVKLTDSLPASAAGVLKYVSSSFVRGSNIQPTVANPAAVVTDASLGDGMLDTVSYDFGAVVNPSPAFGQPAIPLANKQITMDVTAVVVNAVSNVDGAVLTNNASVQVGPGLTGTAAVSVDIVEPVLSVVKETTATTVQAGQTIPYTITLQHATASHADAYDVMWQDALPAGLTYVVGSLNTVSGPAPSTLGAVGNTLSATWNSFAQGAVTVLGFNVTVDASVVPSQTITNKADVSWTSLPGVDPNERTGTTSGTKGVIVSDPGVTKTVLSTSEASTGTAINGAGSDLTIGEHVFYRITANFIKGTTPNASVEDQLPKTTSAFKVVSSRIVSIGAGLAGASLPAVGAAGVNSDTNGDGVMDLVKWTLGTVVNTNPVGGPAVADQIVFEVEAVVADNALNKGILDNQTNQAKLSYDAAGGVQTVKLATAAVDVVEPLLKITKALVTPVSGFAGAGDLLTFRVGLAHLPTSSADAFNVTVTDVLPLANTWVGLSAASTCPGLVLDIASAPTIKFTVPVLTLASANCKIEYEVSVNPAGAGPTNSQAGQTYINNAALAFDSTPVYVPGESRRNTNGTASAQFTIAAPTLVKTAVSTNVAQTGSSAYRAGNFDVAIGELVDFDITVLVPDAGVVNGVITDILPANAATGLLEVVGASVVSLGTNLTTSLPGAPVMSDTQLVDGLKDKVVFDFGTISNTNDGVSDAKDTIVVRVTARVVNRPANIDGLLLTNNASFIFNGGPVGGLVASAAVDVVEPILAVTKTMGPSIGGFVDIAMTLTNTGTAPAYNASLEDVLASTNWDVSNITPVTVPAGYVFANTAGPGAARTVKVSSDPTAVAPVGVLLPGSSVTAIFRAKLVVTATPTTPVNNTATLTTANSIPEVGVPVNGRPVTPKNGIAALDLPRLLATKTVAIKTDADASGGASPGDTLTYTITLVNGGTAALTGVNLDDTPDVNTLLQVGTVTTSAGTIVLGNTAGNTKVQVSVPTIGAGVTTTVSYDVKVVDILPVGVTQLSNQGRVTSTELPPVLTDDPTPPGGQDPTVLPVTSSADVSVVKTVQGVVPPAPGQNVVYTIRVSNAGPNTAADVKLGDILPSYLSFVGASAPCVGGFPCSLGNLAKNAFVDITLTTTLAATFIGPSISNTATVTSVTPDPVPVVNNRSTATTLTAPQISVVKTLTSESGFAPGQVEPNEKLVYTLTVVNTGGTGSATYALTDLMTPANAIASVVASNAGVYNAVAGTVNWVALNIPPQTGPMPALVPVTVEVTAKAVLPPGLVSLKNQAFQAGTPPPVCPGPACVDTPVFVPALTTIPTLNDWGKLILMGLLILLVARRLRVQRRVPA